MAQQRRRLSHGKHHRRISPEGEPDREVSKHEAIPQLFSLSKLLPVILFLLFIAAGNVQPGEGVCIICLIQLMDTGGNHAVWRCIAGDGLQIAAIQPHRLFPACLFCVLRLGSTQHLQGLQELMFPGLVIKMNDGLVTLVPVEEAGDGSFLPSFLTIQEFRRCFPGDGSILLIAAGRIQTACTPDDDCIILGKAAVVRVLKHVGRVYARLGKLPLRKRKVLLCSPERAEAQLTVIVLQGFRRIGLNSRKQEILKSMIMDSRLHIIKIAHQIIGKTCSTGACSPIAVTEPGAQDEIQSPLGLFHQAQIQHFILFAAPGVFEHGLYHFARLSRLL